MVRSIYKFYYPTTVTFQEGHEKVAEILIEHNADVNAEANDKTTALHLAAQNGKFL